MHSSSIAGPDTVITNSQKQLRVIIGSETLTLEGEWSIDQQKLPDSKIDLNGTTVSFNYLINLENSNNLIHPDDLHLVQQMLRDLQHGKSVDYHFRLITPAGELKPIRGHANFIEQSTAQGDGHSVADWDETTGKDELKIRIFEYAERVADIGSWTWNIETNEFYYSDNVYRIYGLEPQSIQPTFETFLKFIHPEDLPNVIQIIGYMQERQLPFTAEYRIIRSDVEVRYVKSKSEKFKTRNGQRYFIGTTQDITARKKNEEQITQQANLIRRVLEISPDIIQIVNIGADTIIYLNRMILEDLGYTFNEIKKHDVKKTLIDLYHTDDVEKIREFKSSMAMASDDDVHEVEARIKAKDGSWQWYKTRGKIFERDADGNPVRYIAFSQNITLSKNGEEERRQHQLLAEMDRAKTAFFSNVSHEFRTPLTLLLGPLEDVVKNSGSSLNRQDTDKLQMAYRNGLRLQKLVNTLLDFSRIEAGRIDAIYQPTDIVSFTKDLASNFRSAIEKAGLKIVIKCAEIKDPVYVNRDMWEKIVLNLLSNAFKFTFEGKIEVVIKSKKKSVDLRVRDTGIGISPENVSKIFDRFTRIEGVKSRTHEGSGIGLALVRELVRIHGGAIKVNSTEGRGSEFIVSIPKGKTHLPSKRIYESKDNTRAGTASIAYVEEALNWLSADDQIMDDRNRSKHGLHHEKASEGFEFKRPTVLVADDNADMRQYLVGLLSVDYQVVATENGKKAVDLIKNGLQPDLVVADVMMPQLDGFGLTTAIKDNAPTTHVPVILLSARAGEEARIEGMQSGADDYLVKPFSSRELISRIEARIQIARTQHKLEHTLREVNRDLEQREKKRTKELQESKNLLEKQKNLLQKTLDAIPQMVWVADARGNIQLFNDRWFIYTGLSREQTKNSPLQNLDVFSTRESKQQLTRFAHCLAEGIPYYGEVMIRNKEGKYRWQMEVALPIRDDAGDIDLWVGTFTDIHDQFIREKKITGIKERT